MRPINAPLTPQHGQARLQVQTGGPGMTRTVVKSVFKQRNMEILGGSTLSVSGQFPTPREVPADSVNSFTFLNNKNKISIVHNSFIYHKDHRSTTKDLQNWRCKHWSTSNTCRARIVTNFNDEVLCSTSSSNIEHNHSQETEADLFKCKINEQVKQQAIDQIEKNPLRLMLELFSHYPGHNVNFKELGNFKQAIYRKRTEFRPTLPKSFDDCIKMLKDQMEKKQIKGSDLLCHVSDDIVMLKCELSVELLENDSEQLFSDGSFKFCPSVKKPENKEDFLQFYTFHIFKNGFYIPTVCFLLKDKSEKSYRKMLGLLKDHLQFPIYPKICIIDFEKSMINALHSVFPRALKRGCHFHLGQSWMRKINNLGLKSLYSNNNSIVGLWLKHVFALPYFDKDRVENVFLHFLKPCAPQTDMINQFILYLETYYIFSHSVYPPSFWAGLGTTTFKTTNNGAESFHRMLGSLFNHSHPNIYDFLETWSLMVKDYSKIKANDNSVNPRAVETKSFRDEYKTFCLGQMTVWEYIALVKPECLPVVRTISTSPQ